MRLFLLLLLAALLSGPAGAQTAPKKTSPKKTKVVKKTMVKAKAKAPAKKAAAKPVEEAEAPVVTFKRTVCFGTCPAYTASIYADGRVDYEGQQHVPVLGKKQFQLPLTTVAEMLRISQEAHFEQLSDFYSKGTTDIPSTVVAVLLPSGKLKSVTVEEGAPDELMGLISYLRSQLDPLAGIAPSADR